VEGAGEDATEVIGRRCPDAQRGAHVNTRRLFFMHRPAHAHLCWDGSRRRSFSQTKY
jgi:hypothetical protein